MQDPHRLCGVILAAGESSRMGTDKALLPWPPHAAVPQVSNPTPDSRVPPASNQSPEIRVPPVPRTWGPGSEPLSPTPSGRTLLSAAILALEPHARAIVVVAGRNADTIAPTVGACAAYLVRNPDPSRGQFSSLQIGLRAALDHGCNAAMITPVDCPPLAPASLALLRDAFDRARAGGLWAVAPENNGHHGHPLIVSREFIDAFLAAPVTANAREILHTFADRLVYVQVPDDLSRAGMNTPEEYAAYAEDQPAKN
jgi:molybdenum cofactor cytidylyltransferase